MLLLLPLVLSAVLVGMFVFDGDVGVMSKFLLLLFFAGTFAIRFVAPELALAGTLGQILICIVLAIRMKLAAQ